MSTLSGVQELQVAIQMPVPFTEYLRRRMTGEDSRWPELTKPDVAELARQAGVPYARTYLHFPSPEEFNDIGLPPAFVLKPVRWQSMRGVMLLRRNDDGSYWESMKRQRLTAHSIRDAQIAWRARKDAPRPYELIAEERHVDEHGAEIPLDYKVFTFFGEPKFIAQFDRNHERPRLAFFDGAFRPLDLERCLSPELKRVDPGERRLPSCAAGILDVARRMSLAVNTPFVSVDTYATAKGACLGELTPTPGAPHVGMYRFTPAFDLELGAAWGEAALRLGMSG